MGQQFTGMDGTITVTEDGALVLEFGGMFAHPDKKAVSPVRVPLSEITGAELIPRRGLTATHLRIHRDRTTSLAGYKPKQDPHTLMLDKAKDIEAIRPLLDWLTGRTPTLTGPMERTGSGERRDVDAARAAMVNKFGTRRELRNLEERLLPGEVLQHIAGGRYGGKKGLLALTDQRVLFLTDGVLNRGTQEYPVGSISGVHLKSGLLTSTLELVASGARVTVDQMQKLDAEPLTNRLRQRISGVPLPATGTYVPAAGLAHRTGQATPPPQVSSVSSGVGLDKMDDVVTQALTRLADLRDRGALTDEEFAAQKARLLST